MKGIYAAHWLSLTRAITNDREKEVRTLQVFLAQDPRVATVVSHIEKLQVFMSSFDRIHPELTSPGLLPISIPNLMIKLSFGNQTIYL